MTSADARPDDQPDLAQEPERHVEIRTIGPNRAEVLLDGHDIAKRITGLQLTCDATVEGGTDLLIRLAPSAANDTMFDGMARVIIGEPADPGPAAAHFLEQVDWEQLEQAALNRPDLESGRGGLTRAMLRQLAEWASGRP